MEKINILQGIFSSWIFIIIMVSTVSFQVVMVEFLGKIAGTVPLNGQLWGVSVLVGSTSLVVGALLKYIPVSVKSSTQRLIKHHDGYEPIPSGPDQV